MHPHNTPHTIMDEMIERAIPAVDKAMRTPGYDQDVINRSVARAALTAALCDGVSLDDALTSVDAYEIRATQSAADGEWEVLIADGQWRGTGPTIDTAIIAAVSNAKGKTMSDNGMPQPATMSLPDDFKNSVNEALERKRKSDPLYHALLSQMSVMMPLTPEQAADLAYYTIEHDRNYRRAEAQVRRLQAVARAAQQVWEKSETEDEMWAYRDMIDAIEALQPGDV